MMMWTLFVLAAVLPCSHGQDFAGWPPKLRNWCPNLDTDMVACVKQHVGHLEGISQFPDISEVFNIQTVISNIKVVSAFCHPSALPAVENYFGYIYGKMWPCIPSDWKKAFPDLEKAKGMFRFMCENTKDLDINCVAEPKKMKPFATCLAPRTSKPDDLSTVDAFLEYACSFTSKINRCIDTTYGTCPRKSAEVLKKSYAKSLPVGCDACISKSSLILLVACIVLFFLNY